MAPATLDESRSQIHKGRNLQIVLSFFILNHLSPLLLPGFVAISLLSLLVILHCRFCFLRSTTIPFCGFVCILSCTFLTSNIFFEELADFFFVSSATSLVSTFRNVTNIFLMRSNSNLSGSFLSPLPPPPLPPNLAPICLSVPTAKATAVRASATVCASCLDGEVAEEVPSSLSPPSDDSMTRRNGCICFRISFSASTVFRNGASSFDEAIGSSSRHYVASLL